MPLFPQIIKIVTFVGHVLRHEFSSVYEELKVAIDRWNSHVTNRNQELETFRRRHQASCRYSSSSTEKIIWVQSIITKSITLLNSLMDLLIIDQWT